MTGQAATDLFRIRDHVAEFDDVVTVFRQLSAESRARLRCETDIRYGDNPGESLDIFYPPAGPSKAAGLPVHIFIHGGYWRMFSKNDFSYVADTITAAGAIAVILDYVLMPAQRLATLIGQVRQAATWVTQEIAARGGDPARLSVSGHSAGAHLASWLVDEPAPDRAFHIRSCLLLGGLYDLRPLQQSFLQAELNLTDDEVERWTPLSSRHQPGCRYSLLVGEKETLPFHDQAHHFHRHLVDGGCHVELRLVPATNHMTSVLALGNPAGFAGRRLIEIIAG